MHFSRLFAKNFPDMSKISFHSISFPYLPNYSIIQCSNSDLVLSVDISTVTQNMQNLFTNNLKLTLSTFTDINISGPHMIHKQSNNSSLTGLLLYAQYSSVYLSPFFLLEADVITSELNPASFNADIEPETLADTSRADTLQRWQDNDSYISNCMSWSKLPVTAYHTLWSEKNTHSHFFHISMSDV